MRVAGVNVEGDDQADRRVHGGPDKAVYAYAAEDTAFWEAELGRELGPGAFGENLTTEGLDVSGAVVGERWRIGDVELEVCQPRLPCAKLALRMGEPTMVKRFAQASRPGAYLRIVSEGSLGAGDAIEVVSRPEHGVTCGMSATRSCSTRRCWSARPRRPSSRPTWRSGCASAPRRRGATRAAGSAPQRAAERG